MRSSPARGRWAEDRALEYLTEELGCRLRDRNVRLAGGEIDLIVRDGDTEVFVEVKARRTGGASGSVTADKQRRLGRAAAAWIARRGMPRGGCRFDVVTVEGRGPETRLQHLRHAFETPDRWGV